MTPRLRAGRTVFWWLAGGLIAVVLGTLPRQGPSVELVRSYLWWLGVLLTGIALAVHLALLGANAVNPPRLRSVVIVPLLIAAVAGIAAWAVGWYRMLRPPVGS